MRRGKNAAQEAQRMKWIVIGVLTGGTGIVALAWWLADRRLGQMCYSFESYCNASQLATRDWTLVAGIALTRPTYQG